jgi:hypothetical protein
MLLQRIRCKRTAEHDTWHDLIAACLRWSTGEQEATPWCKPIGYAPPAAATMAAEKALRANELDLALS